jgi:uncharacterized protein (TIGR02757 family)
MKSAKNSIPDLIKPIAQHSSLQQWLDTTADEMNHPDFIAEDPVSVPHRYSVVQDIEIAGFFAAIMAWGQRKTIIRKANELMQLMDDAPYDFIMHHQEIDRTRFSSFTHRTLQPADVIYLVDVLQRYYQHHQSLEDAFASAISPTDEDVIHGLNAFHHMVFDQAWVLERTRKHIASPDRKSACKRLNMYLRWMVRSDDRGVDFGLWKKINSSQLIIPLDVHVGNVGRQLNLLTRKVNDWQAAKELTECLKQFDPADPVRYDFALFGAAVRKGPPSPRLWRMQ